GLALSNLRNEFVVWGRETGCQRHFWRGSLGLGFHVGSGLGGRRGRKYGDGHQSARLDQLVLADRRQSTWLILSQTRVLRDAGIRPSSSRGTSGFRSGERRLE